MHKKYLLMQEFGELQLQNLTITSINEVDMQAACNFDYVEASKANHAHYRPERAYAVGMNYSWLRGKFDRIVCVTDVNLSTSCELIQKASDYYQSDSTYLDFLSGIEAGTATALVYRRINPAKNDFPNKSEFEYMMWKEERLQLLNGVLKVSTEKKMNEHMF